MKNKNGYSMVEAMAGMVFVSVLILFLVIIGFGVSSCRSIQKNGIKPVIERVWYGPTNSANTNIIYDTYNVR